MIAHALPNTLDELNVWEQHLIDDFQNHPLFKKLQDPRKMPVSEFHGVLLQRRFFSIAYTPTTDLAIDGLVCMNASEDILHIVRHILREEYPGEDGSKPSHRELLIADLRRIHIPVEDILNTQPTSETLRCLRETYAIFHKAESDEFYLLKMLTLVRLWGEWLVATEYDAFWSRLMSEGLEVTTRKTEWSFYYDHLAHDKPECKFNDPGLGMSDRHTDRLTRQIQKLLIELGVPGIHFFARTEERIAAIKIRFYNQFMS